MTCPQPSLIMKLIPEDAFPVLSSLLLVFVEHSLVLDVQIPFLVLVPNKHMVLTCICIQHIVRQFLYVTFTTINSQGCENIDPTAEHFDLFSSSLSCSPYTLYTVQFQFTGHSLDLLDNVLHDWLFPHHCK